MEKRLTRERESVKRPVKGEEENLRRLSTEKGEEAQRS